MQTLTQNPLEFRQVHDTEYRLFVDGRNVGAIAFNITAMRWEYNRLSEPVKAVGTLEQCKAAAEADYVNSIRLVCVTDMASLTQHINQAKADGIPTIIWQVGEDAPLWWTECLQASVRAARLGWVA